MYSIIIIIIMSHRQHGSPDSFLPPVSIVHCSREVFQATSLISREYLFISSSWSSKLRSSMWRGPQEYIAYAFVLNSPPVSRMSGASNLNSFFWWVIGGGIASVLLGVASKTYSIWWAVFLCNCRHVFSLCLWLASMWCIHSAVSRRPLVL